MLESKPHIAMDIDDYQYYTDEEPISERRRSSTLASRRLSTATTGSNPDDHDGDWKTVHSPSVERRRSRSRSWVKVPKPRRLSDGVIEDGYEVLSAREMEEVGCKCHLSPNSHPLLGMLRDQILSGYDELKIIDC